MHEEPVHAFDCTDPLHEPAHFTADSEAALAGKVLAHFAEYHPELAPEAVRETFLTGAYLEERPTEGSERPTLIP